MRVARFISRRKFTKRLQRFINGAIPMLFCCVVLILLYHFGIEVLIYAYAIGLLGRSYDSIRKHTNATS